MSLAQKNKTAPKKILPFVIACEQALCLGKNSEERDGKGEREAFSLFPSPHAARLKACSQATFVTQYHPALPNLKDTLMGKWHLIENQPQLREIFKEPPIISYRKGKSLKDILVKTKL